MNESKGRFELNRAGIKAILQSEEAMAIARQEAQKKGEVVVEYVGTQRVWVKGKEDD